MSPGFAAAPVTMTATAAQLQPQVEEIAAAPTPEMTAEAAPEPVAEPMLQAASAVAETVAQTPEAMAEAASSFIPPRPTESFVRQPLQQAAQATPQPASQQAAPVPAPEKKRAFSLFERVTGAARRAEAAAAAVQPSAPAPAAERATPTFGARVAPQRQPETMMIPVGQPRLGIDAPAKPKASTPEDDLLEIPAFLRRQAN
jgi:cell division protein FtsZ